MSFVGFLAVGTVMMFASMGYAGRQYRLPLWKIAVAALAVLAGGWLGGYLLAWLELGSWGGRSFYGAVFLVPIVMALAAAAVRAPRADFLDLGAPAGGMMVAVLKVNCYLTGCCGGRTISSRYFGRPVVFPSQIVECANGLVITGVFLWLIHKKKARGVHYPLFMIIYGVTRFIWNLFRFTVRFVWILPAGNFWSLISIAIGVIWLLLAKRKENGRLALADLELEAHPEQGT